MRKYVVIVIFCCGVVQSLIAQCESDSPYVCRSGLAVYIFSNLYGQTANVNDYAAAYFPNPYIDLQEDNEFYRKLKILSYLQYDNGFSVFDFSLNPSYRFNITSEITRIEATVFILEAWNIEPDFSNGSPFDDIDENDSFYGYAKKAYQEGFIDISHGDFNPFELLTIEETISFIDRVVASKYHPVNQNELKDLDNYFVPGIYSPFNISHSRGLEQGVLNHYAKNTFSIPDRKMNLNFSHFYSSTMVEMPNGFYKIKPLGTGWSHTYNSYIFLEKNVGTEKVDYYFIVWPNGTIDVFDEDEEEYVSNGVYDELDELSSDRIRITKKNQTQFYYKQLDDDRDIWYLIEVEDSNGNRTSVNYESAEEKDTRRIEYVEAPSGKKLKFSYENDYDFLKEIEDPMGRIIEFDVDSERDQRLEDFTDAKGYKTKYKYAENDQEAPLAQQRQRFLLEKILLPKGNEIIADFDTKDAKLSSYQVNNKEPVKISVDFDYKNSSESAEILSPIYDGRNFKETYKFNLNGVVTEYESDISNVSFNYPKTGVNIMLPDQTNLNGVNIEYDYDDMGNITKVDKEDGYIVEYFDYDSDNNLIMYTDGEENTTEFRYDGDNNLVSVIDALGNTINYQYNSYGQLESLTDQEDKSIYYEYENDGALIKVTLPEGIESSFNYDEVNRLISRNDNGLISTYQWDDNDNMSDFTNSGGYSTIFNYDANDNLSVITNANNVETSFEYDDEDRVIKETFGNLVKDYRYDDEGYLEQYTKPSGQRIAYDYDRYGRLVETGTVKEIEYNNRNLIETVTKNEGSIRFEYDKVNRVEEVRTVHDYKIKYDYEKTNAVDEIEYPIINGNEVEVEYTYDHKNRIRFVTIFGNVINKRIATFTYFDNDLLERITFGNNTTSNYFYDDAGRMVINQNINENTDEDIYVAIYELDLRGNIIEEQEVFQPTPPGFNPGDSPSSQIDYSYNENNHITSSGFKVDEDGNMIQDPYTTYKYDIDDRLTHVEGGIHTLNFKYNGYGQRVEKIIDAQKTIYVRDVLRDNVLIEVDADGSPTYYYILTPSGRILARMNPQGELSYYYGDARGSVIAIANENAELTHQYRYDEFGNLNKVYEPDNDFNPYRYVGLYGVEYDDKDLYYMRARYYQPSTGRFFTEDPIWSTNLYPYAGNNPKSQVDPFGKEGVNVFIETDGVGHTYIDVNETIFSYGRYNGSTSPLLKSLGPFGDGVLLKYSESDRNQFLVGRSQNPTYMFHLSEIDADKVFNYLNLIYGQGKENSKNSGGNIIDTYNILQNNCTTFIIDALNAGGGNYSRKNNIPLELLLTLAIQKT